MPKLRTHHIRLGHGDIASSSETRRWGPCDGLIVIIVAADRRVMSATILLRCQLQQ